MSTTILESKSEKKKLNLGLSSLMLFLIISNSSCASSQIQLPPKLESRTLKVSSQPGCVEYQWQECTKKGLFGNCKTWEVKQEIYDLNDDNVRAMLRHLGFVMVVEKPLP
jgi:hypothetical protein